MRIAVGQFSHETNSFSSEKTHEGHFRRISWRQGKEIIDSNIGVKNYISGFVTESERIGGYELLPIFSAEALPSGCIAASTWATIRRRFLEGFRSAYPFDAIFLDLHGAAVSETSFDLEGDLLSDLRAEFGSNIPIVTTLDLHGNITQRMVESADMMFGVVEYPHIDTYERGCEAMKNLDLQLRGKIQPRMAIVRLPMVMPMTTTFSGPAKFVNDRCAEWEARPGVIDCTFFHGFPYTDGPQAAVSVVAIADGNRGLAEAAAKDIADIIWNMRRDFAVPLPDVRTGLAEALRNPEIPVLVNETSDNPGCGTPGDGTYLLQAMLEEDCPRTVFCHLSDPEVVSIAHAAGEGAEIDVLLGGKVDNLHGASLPVKAKVILATHCRFVSTGPLLQGKERDFGKSARLLIGNVDVIVTEKKSQTLNNDILTLHGISAGDYKVIGIKSSQHFRAFFEGYAKKIITVDSPGISTNKLDEFKYTSSIRHKFPLDSDGRGRREARRLFR